MRDELLIIFLSILTFGCTSNREIEIDSSFFTADQYVEINHILDNFDKNLQDQTKKSSVKEAYLAYSKEMSKALIKPRRNEFYNSIDNLIGLKVFKEIWFSYDSTPDITITLLKTVDEDHIEEYPIKLNYNPQQSFFKLIKKQGDKNNFILSYFNTIEPMGDCSPQCALEFPNKVFEFDLENRNHRLIIAIHYITLAYR